MAQILLSTLNSRYQHSSFGLRYLKANLGQLKEDCEILEFVISKSAKDIVEVILQKKPRILGVGVYIWNTTQVFEVVSLIKLLAPEIIIVLGGPEISFETEKQELYQIADYVIQGEADFLFRDFCQQILIHNQLPPNKIIRGPRPDINQIQFPYELYTDEDIQHRVIYVEASRGCPYKCEYCLSSLDESVRSFPLDDFLQELSKLIERGARQFKFVDRTFNLSINKSIKILQFFLDRMELGLFLHFEMVPDRLPQELKELIKDFPAGSLQFEIGVQTWNPLVAFNVSRRQDYSKILENFAFLRRETKVHTHADLIVGLPGESLESFAKGFDALWSCEPDEIQVGILKRLKGTPIVRHDEKFSMKYSMHPPFQILSNNELDYLALQKLGRFAQYWDLYANSGNFPSLMTYFRKICHESSRTPFKLFWDFSQFLFHRHGQTHAISLASLRLSAKDFLVTYLQLDEDQANDLTTDKRRSNKDNVNIPARQKKHLENFQAHPSN